MAIARSSSVPRVSGTVLVFIVALAIGGCTVRLAPDYNKSIVDGLVKANTETMTLFASVSDGADGVTFDEREETYNKIIGQFDALRIYCTARLTPRPLIARWLGIGHASAETPDEIDEIELLKSPSEEILAHIVEILTRMRDTDKKGTLDKNKMNADGGFRNSYEISFQQVLTYEKALER